MSNHAESPRAGVKPDERILARVGKELAEASCVVRRRRRGVARALFLTEKAALREYLEPSGQLAVAVPAGVEVLPPATREDRRGPPSCGTSTKGPGRSPVPRGFTAQINGLAGREKAQSPTQRSSGSALGVATGAL